MIVKVITHFKINNRLPKKLIHLIIKILNSIHKSFKHKIIIFSIKNTLFLKLKSL